MLTEVDRARLIAAREDLKTHPKGFNMGGWSTCIASRISRTETGVEFHAPLIHQLQDTLHPLFGISSWPSDLADRYAKAAVAEYSFIRHGEKPAQVGVEVIDRFLEADGNEKVFQTPRIPAMIPKPKALVTAAKATVAAGTIGTALGLLLTFLVR